MFSIKSQIENALRKAVQVALPMRKQVEIKALSDFEVNHCTSDHKPNFHYTSNLPALIWEYGTCNSSKGEAPDYFGMATAKGNSLSYSW